MQFSLFPRTPAVPVAPRRSRVFRITAVTNIAGAPRDIANGVEHTVVPDVSKLSNLYVPESSNGHSNGNGVLRNLLGFSTHLQIDHLRVPIGCLCTS